MPEAITPDSRSPNGRESSARSPGDDRVCGIASVRLPTGLAIVLLPLSASGLLDPINALMPRVALT